MLKAHYLSYILFYVYYILFSVYNLLFSVYNVLFSVLQLLISILSSKSSNFIGLLIKSKEVKFKNFSAHSN